MAGMRRGASVGSKKRSLEAADEKPLVHDLGVHAWMLDAPRPQVEANLHALRALIRGREKHVKLGWAERIDDVAALAELGRELVERGGIANADSHEDWLGSLAALEVGASTASAAQAPRREGFPRRWICLTATNVGKHAPRVV